MTFQWPSWVHPLPFPFPELHNRNMIDMKVYLIRAANEISQNVHNIWTNVFPRLWSMRALVDAFNKKMALVQTWGLLRIFSKVSWNFVDSSQLLKYLPTLLLILTILSFSLSPALWLWPPGTILATNTPTCSTAHYSTVQNNALQYSTVQYRIMHYSTSSSW